MIFISPNNEYPRHIGDIQIDYPNWQEGEELPLGWKQVEPVAKPEVTADEIAFEDFPVEVDGIYKQNWKVRPLTDEEKARRLAPETARQKLKEIGLTEAEIRALVNNLVL